MKRVYAPWRSVYLMDESVRTEGCLFCGIEVDPGNDRENFVIERGTHWYTIINRYPYTTGHIMVVCRRHAENFGELSAAERCELVDSIARGEQAVRTAYSPDGINVGANLGRSAGAGIVGHLHVHIVPRWHGDTNFMSTVGDTRVVSEDLAATCKKIRRALPPDSQEDTHGSET